MREVLRVTGVARLDVGASFERFNPNFPLSKTNVGYDLGAWLRATLGSTNYLPRAP